ncbi:Protein of unknown function [Ectothiorhodospira mobilis]|uniref:Thymidine phosphorylase n=1 Tax=Ectothiorhodospira mobilis TaxID=195064 RepID=A0A1I4S3Q1_ECTMO|nr:DUF1631 domain-containing protein [Ectothiorhodospira mobilis]SFM58873.1 Protein of unknown function [Ectothiorhodospira mobilis]
MNSKAEDNVVAFRAATRAGGAASPREVVGYCRNLAMGHVQPLLQEMLDKADDALFRLADKAEDNRTQTAYFEAMRALRRQRSTVESEYATQLARTFDALLLPPGKAGPADPAQAQPQGLTLVGSDELEENLAVEGMAGKVRRTHQTALYGIGHRLAHVLQRPPPDEAGHPLDPETFCQAFREALRALDLEIRIRLVILKLFDQHVASRLGPLYEEVNAYLVGRGILPDLRQGPAPRASGPSREGAAASSTGPGPEEEGGGEGDLVALLQRLARPRPGGGAAAGGVPGGTFGQGSPAGGAVADAPALAAALSHLAADEPIPGAQLKGAVMGALDPGGGRAVALSGVDESAIDIVAMLFDFILDDPTLPAPARALIGRLQIPVLKVAVLDKSFFSQRRHPVRRFLSALSRVDVAWWEEGGDGRLQDLVEGLVSASDGDATAFAEALEALQALQEAARAAADREEASTTRAVQDRDRALLTRGMAEEAVARVMEGRPLPPPVEAFLQGAWRDLLMDIARREGQGGEDWQQALNVASLLVWSLAPKPDPQAREQLRHLLPTLLRGLEEGMQRLDLPAAERRALLDLLAREHARLVRRSEPPEGDADKAAEAGGGTVSAPQVASGPVPADGRSFMARKVEEINRRISEGRFTLPGESDPAEGGVEDLHAMTARELEEGTWLEHRAEDEAQPVRMKLSWKSLISGRYLFVDARGLKVREMDATSLAAAFRAGRARIAEHTPVFERAIGSLMQRLEADPD